MTVRWFSQGITDTFSGDRPCAMCRSLEQQEDQHNEAQRTRLETMRLLVATLEPPIVGDLTLSAPSVSTFLVQKMSRFRSRCDRPALPPAFFVKPQILLYLSH